LQLGHDWAIDTDPQVVDEIGGEDMRIVDRDILARTDGVE
jgi:hypothetical protein